MHLALCLTRKPSRACQISGSIKAASPSFFLLLLRRQAPSYGLEGQGGVYCFSHKRPGQVIDLDNGRSDTLQPASTDVGELEPFLMVTSTPMLVCCGCGTLWVRIPTHQHQHVFLKDSTGNGFSGFRAQSSPRRGHG